MKFWAIASQSQLSFGFTHSLDLTYLLKTRPLRFQGAIEIGAAVVFARLTGTLSSLRCLASEE